jgi:hypothetical protein
VGWNEKERKSHLQPPQRDGVWLQRALLQSQPNSIQSGPGILPHVDHPFLGNQIVTSLRREGKGVRERKQANGRADVVREEVRLMWKCGCPWNWFTDFDYVPYNHIPSLLVHNTLHISRYPSTSCFRGVASSVLDFLVPCGATHLPISTPHATT